MEIKRLVDHIQALKTLRNTLEARVDTIYDEGKEVNKEAEEADRAGLVYRTPIVDWESINDGHSSVKYALKQLNEGISHLESAYRRSVRFKEDKNSDTPKDKGDSK